MKYSSRVCILIVTIISYIIIIFSHSASLTKRDLLLIPLFSLIAWYSGKQYDLAKFYSEKDFLTKVYNRRFAEKIFPKLKSKMEKANCTLAIFVLDINNFKTINDTFGHGKGDQVLVMLANLLSENITKADILIRWGGDEFLIMAPATNQVDADRIIEKIEKSLGESVENNRDFHFDIDLSIGYSICPSQADEFEEAIIMADKQMYTTKRQKKTNEILEY